MNNHVFHQLFPKKPVLLGMVHLPGLPGSPNAARFDEVIAAALNDARILQDCGFSGILFENLGDYPYYPDHVPAETVAALAIIADRIKSSCNVPVGVNVLRNDALSALAIAAAARLQFLRVNVLAGTAVTDQGLLTGKAHLLLRERKRLGATGIQIYADIRVKHAAPLVQRDLEQEVEEYFERAMCDALIVSGSGSGKEVDIEFLRQVKKAAGQRPVLIGSGLSAKNAAELLRIADGAIVGSAIKFDAQIHQRIDPQQARALVQACQVL